MENRYILTQSGSFVSEDELYHAGIKGMKWGVRRYQNPDGSLTPAGRKRYMNSDGTLNKKGEKYYAKESARLKEEKARLANEKKTSTKLAKLDKMRTKNAELQSEVEGKKTVKEDGVDYQSIASKLPKQHDVSSLTTKEIQDYNNRMQSEENFKQLLERRGYKVSLDQKTEIDQRIDELNKQKTLMQLEKDVANMSRGKSAAEEKIAQLTQQRDIAKLEKEIRDNTPQKENKLSKFINSQAGQNITNQLIKSGENLLTTYMKNRGDKNADLTSEGVKEVKDSVGKILGKEAKNVAKAVEKEQKKQAAKEAKAEEKQAKKDAKKEAKAAEKEVKKADKAYKKAAKTINDMADSSSKAVDKVEKVEAEFVGNASDFRKVSNNGKSYVSNNANTSISTFVRNSPTYNNPEYVKRIETDYGYRYIYELPSSIDR